MSLTIDRAGVCWRSMAVREHQDLLTRALEREGEAQAALLAGEGEEAAELFREVSDLYRQSWEAAPPGAYGRLVGLLKAAILAGGGDREARYVRDALGGGEPGSPTAAYALALAALVQGGDEVAERAAGAMADGGDAFARTAGAIAALARADGSAYRRAIEAILADFASRADHLTGVPIADTAAVLERIAESRGLAARPDSPLMGP